jgi:Sulfotransferase family
MSRRALFFLHVPKTAGTSFRFILENTFGMGHCHAGHLGIPHLSPEHLRFVRKVFPHLRSLAGHNLLDPLQHGTSSFFYMTFLREPIARVISQYQDGVHRKDHTLRNGPETFEQALRRKEELENLHVKMMAGARDLDKAKRFLEKCDFVGLTEEFDKSLQVLERLCPQRLKLSYKRKLVARDYAVRNSIRSDQSLLEMARDHNRLDLELYAFARDEVFPRLCSRAKISEAGVPTYETLKTELQPGYQLGRLYNRLVFRQLCKLVFSATRNGALSWRLIDAS